MTNKREFQRNSYFFASRVGIPGRFLFIKNSILKELEERGDLPEISICEQFLNTDWGVDVGRAGAKDYRSWELVGKQDIRTLKRVLDIVFEALDPTNPVDTEHWEILESHGFQTRYFVARATKTQDLYLFIRKDILSDIKLSEGLEYLEIAGENLYNSWGSATFCTVSFSKYRAAKIGIDSDLEKLFKILDIATESINPNCVQLDKSWELF